MSGYSTQCWHICVHYCGIIWHKSLTWWHKWHILTHWGRVTHICVSKLIAIGSDNGLSPSRRQAIIWTNAGILSIGPLETNFSEILIEIIIVSFKKMRLKVSSAIRRPFCLSLNVWTQWLPFCRWYSCAFFSFEQFKSWFKWQRSLYLRVKLVIKPKRHKAIYWTNTDPVYSHECTHGP